MSPQTNTKASVGFKAGVKDYKLTYYTPEYETKDIDILAAFRVTPQPGVPPEERGFTANTSLAHYCRDNGPLLHIHRAMHAVINRQKNHGMHFRVLAKALRPSVASTVVGKLEGERDITLGFVFCLWLGGIHVWHMPSRPRSLERFRTTIGGGTLGHPWGNAPGTVANRVALEACVQARNEGRDLAVKIESKGEGD
ncbi:hypothetical protein FNV43_RR16985 [Rhamnella rubrinervis]|uniref:Ribulose bisphosphate carboxylase large chain n=1 Tax=Rhamnella rubrinervis TaxID=2594499 RepID=A0A8K0GZU1_9ROSA|nr:hypothetical protein FNV43_RR16985 [Rhamnella rubrinervis]